LESRDLAIAILLAEHRAIDAQLAQFGHGKAPGKKRGRPAKLSQFPDSPDTK